jgi:hypothetical protein
MEREEKWHETTWKNDPDEIGYALKSGHVEIIEHFENDNTSIFHEISGVDYGSIKHVLFYRSKSYLESLSIRTKFQHLNPLHFYNILHIKLIPNIF